MTARQSVIPTEHKDRIREDLQGYMQKFNGSFEKSAANLRGVISETYLRKIDKGDYEHISDEMWRNLRARVSAQKSEDWNIVDTRATRDLNFIMRETHENTNMTWATASAGSGKSLTCREYVKAHKNVFYVLCDEGMAKSDFAIAFAQAVGVRVNSQRKARETILMAVEQLNVLDNPMIIFDEADKLPDNVLYFFITIYNYLEDHTALFFCSTSYMERRMETGRRLNYKGFEELFSRIGRKFFTVDENNATDVYAVCLANGVTDQKTIDAIIKDAELCDFDMRRVKKRIQAVKRQRASATSKNQA